MLTPGPGLPRQSSALQLDPAGCYQLMSAATLPLTLSFWVPPTSGPSPQVSMWRGRSPWNSRAVPPDPCHSHQPVQLAAPVHTSCPHPSPEPPSETFSGPLEAGEVLRKNCAWADFPKNVTSPRVGGSAVDTPLTLTQGKCLAGVWVAQAFSAVCVFQLRPVGVSSGLGDSAPLVKCKKCR